MCAAKIELCIAHVPTRPLGDWVMMLLCTLDNLAVDYADHRDVSDVADASRCLSACTALVASAAQLLPSLRGLLKPRYGPEASLTAVQSRCCSRMLTCMCQPLQLMQMQVVGMIAMPGHRGISDGGKSQRTTFRVAIFTTHSCLPQDDRRCTQLDCSRLWPPPAPDQRIAFDAAALLLGSCIGGVARLDSSNTISPKSSFESSALLMLRR